MTDVWIEMSLKKVGDTFYCAEAALQSVELELGGQRIDKIYAPWMRVYDELFRQAAEKNQYRRLVDFVDGEAVGATKRFYVPLIFFFNKNPGLALPLIALQYHEVKVHIELASSIDGVDTATTTDPKVAMYCDYVYLDVDERRRFAQSSHEYLIEQLQFTGEEPATIDTVAKKSTNVRLNLNHPCKYLAFVVKGSRHGQFAAGDTANIGTYAEALAPIASCKLTLNGHDRFSERRGSYFNLVQPYQTLKCHPRAGVYLYSFCLKPDEHQPSGSCNFSRIDNATLQITYKKANVNSTQVNAIPDEDCTSNTATSLTSLCVYAVNYNVLRVMSGMGGLAYSN